jgi:hypothetical protein
VFIAEALETVGWVPPHARKMLTLARTSCSVLVAVVSCVGGGVVAMSVMVMKKQHDAEAVKMMDGQS